MLCSNAQVVTVFDEYLATSSDESHQFDVIKLERYANCVLMQFEITALKPIGRLNIYAQNACVFIDYNNKIKLNLKGLYHRDENEIIELYKNSTWGWSDVKNGEKRRYTLYFGGSGKFPETIPAGVTEISVGGIGVEVDGVKTLWRVDEIAINNPRTNYTNYSSEYSVKAHIDANNDEICGIYEQIGDDANYKLACVKQGNEYALIYLSSSMTYSWWKVGDIKAYMRKSASGIFKADWFMSNKYVDTACCIEFSGVSMIVYFVGDGNPEKYVFLKMYPSDTPSKEHNKNNNSDTPDFLRIKNNSQESRTIPKLIKQKVK